MRRRLTIAAALGLGTIATVAQPAASAAPARKAAAPSTFSDGFARLPPGATAGDGGALGAWTVNFTGYGTVRVEQDGGATLALRPKPSTQAGETHSTLVRTQRTFGDLDLRLRVKTVAQLRTGSPANPWETAWVLWHYTDNTHFYSLVLKTDGWELGKEDPAYPGAQRFIATGSDVTFPPGAWHAVRVTQVGARITLAVDGRVLASVTDRERPYVSGAVALYDEDAHARYADVLVGPGR